MLLVFSAPLHRDWGHMLAMDLFLRDVFSCIVVEHFGVFVVEYRDLYSCAISFRIVTVATWTRVDRYCSSG